jgi:hypothetical protein
MPNVEITVSLKPLEKLVDAVQAAIGVLYEPTQIVRRARASAVVTVIMAEADVAKDDVLARAAQRIATSERRRQENIDAVVGSAIEQLPPSVDAAPIDQDWLADFFDQCKDVSNDQLRAVWGKLLANEVAVPSGVSRRTLATLRTLSPADAKLLHLAASLAFKYDEAMFIPEDAWISLTEFGIDFGDILQLETCGLLFQKDIVLPLRVPSGTLYNCAAPIEYTTESTEPIELAVYPLTDTGVELVSACAFAPHHGYIDAALRRLSEEYSIHATKPLG